MSTETKKFQFMAFCPDKTDDGAFQRRMAVREKHLDNAKKLGDVLKFARALLSPDSISSSDAQQKLVGSLMVFEASSAEEVKTILESDLYYTTGVWDPDRMVILPFSGNPF